MTVINSIEINNFRGIKQLTVSDFSKINLIVGDNNSGKTTFLEAIQLLFAKPQLSYVRNVINQRTILKPNNSFYTSFIKMFNIQHSSDRLEFDIYAHTNNGPFEFQLSGNEKSVPGDEVLQISKMSPRQKIEYRLNSSYIPDTARVFTGSIATQNRGKEYENNISCTSLDDRISGPLVKKEVHYIPSFGHLRYDLIKNIVEKPDYKQLAINVLKQFDSSVADICYTKADDGTFIETIITNKGVNMPFSVYGDGIKKILFILNKMVDATDSILLIDEIETGLHKKYFDTLFPIVFALADKLNVQLFIATHSIEAIDAILRYGNYDNNISDNDPIRVITLKRIDSDDGSNIVARNVSGNMYTITEKYLNLRYAYDDRTYAGRRRIGCTAHQLFSSKCIWMEA